MRTTAQHGGGPQRSLPVTRRRWWSAVGVAAVLTSVGLVVALHVLRSELGPAGHRLSEYAVGPWGWLMTAAFVAFAAGALAVRRTLPAGGRLRPVRAALAVAVVGLVLSAVFETDVATPDAPREMVHSLASTSALLALVAAAVWSVTYARAAVVWRRASGAATVAATLAALATAVSPAAHDGPWTGAVQRLCYFALAAWLFLLCRVASRRQ